MWYHNINPVLVSLGPIDIRYYGLVYFAGFIFAYFYLRKKARSEEIKNFDEKKLDSFMIYFILGSIIGGRVLDFLFFYPHVIFQDPLELFRIWNGGMSIHGGIIGAVTAALIFTKKHKIKFYSLADAAIIPLMFMLFIGRIANFINGELWGRLSNSFVCINYEQSQYIANPPMGCRYPYQLYASLKNLFVFGVMVYVKKVNNQLKSGLLFWYSLLLYNIGRFLLDFMRDDPQVLLGLVTGQILCLVFAIVSVVFIVKITREKTKSHN